ncbi:Ger(x)C family spore germination protein [Paenibacillus sp. p3-SID867]|uniref:Ger(x)C family spore germination protein n=1 Tax=Paenibacillus sp. p3-SID867 TaxID=2916363 RepID=UPI0021A30CA4|nr:Ger(x)C family spore germination protein [Paenibacillus sp. p3-SID867]MCT1400388.1 Ger(x)C family spore germination protein [Paenibacillus sp. p3-SID867]
MLKRCTCLLLLLCIIPLSGCGDQRILEDLGFIQTTSYDLLPDGKLAISVSIPQADPETTAKREVLTATANSSKEAKMIMSRRTGMLLVSGQIRNVLFGLSMAENGLHGHLDTLFRDPSISSQVKVSVVEGHAGELLIDDYRQHPRTGRYIDMLLEKEALGQTIPKVTLFNFARDFFDQGVDPVAPIIKKHENNYITTNGIALFRDDRYVTKIEPQDALVFAFLRGKFRDGQINIELSEPGDTKENVMFSSLISSRKVKVTRGAQGVDKVTYHIKVTGTVLEYIGDARLSNDRERHELEKRISKYISKKGDRIITLMKQHQVDNLGIGTVVRNRVGYAQWKKMNWRQELQKLPVECLVEVHIKDYGKFR